MAVLYETWSVSFLFKAGRVLHSYLSIVPIHATMSLSLEDVLGLGEVAPLHTELDASVRDVDGGSSGSLANVLGLEDVLGCVEGDGGC